MIKAQNTDFGFNENCSLCKNTNTLVLFYYSIEFSESYRLCAKCIDVVPKHIPIRQHDRYILRLIGGRKNGFQSEVVR